MAKVAYAGGADAITVLALRMGMALPVFAVVLWRTNRCSKHRLTRRDWGSLMLLGFFGWYLASWLDFKALERISAGLERIVLFTYPVLVVLGTALRRRQLPGAAMTAAALAAWTGIAIAFAGEAGSRSGAGRDLWSGTALVFCSALSYAIFVMVSGDIVKRIGSARFIAAVCTVSSLLILVHWICVKPVKSLLELPPLVWRQGALLATLGTLAPAFLTGWGLKLAGAQQFAIIGSIGPAGTLIMAACWLGEPLDWPRLGGFALTLAGGLAATLLRDNGARSMPVPEIPVGNLRAR
jgi:drug/metabolite transporter (DMT)-like permease